MNYEFFAQTDTGRMRGNNEDSVMFNAEVGLAILADGMGGYNAGEVASSMATAYIGADMGQWLQTAGRQAVSRDVRRALETSAERANRAIFNASLASPQYSGMGTTLVVSVFLPDRLLVGHVGDSRCYRWRSGGLAQITRDHSLLQEQLDAGLITPAQAATASHRNLVTRAVGVEETVLLEITEHPVESGDLFLLCSDGLSDMLTDASIASILLEGGSLAEQAGRLVDSANAQGGRDNISVLLVKAGRRSARQGLLSRLLGK
jgi:protein phosphatase